MIRRSALLFLTVASPVILVLFFTPWSFSEALFSILVMGYPVALIIVATTRNSRLGPLALPLLVLLVLLEGCTLGMLVFRNQVSTAPWVGGLPLTAAFQLYGLWLLPLLLVALVYAATFTRFELGEEDLKQFEGFERRSEIDS
jgi:hypothetical protein